MHERYKELRNTLLCCIEAQIADLKNTDTEELGEAIDMIKDLEEAIYYDVHNRNKIILKPKGGFDPFDF